MEIIVPANGARSHRCHATPECVPTRIVSPIQRSALRFTSRTSVRQLGVSLFRSHPHNWPNSEYQAPQGDYE